METLLVQLLQVKLLGVCPHSLGTLIEWKLNYRGDSGEAIKKSPHSLGTLIEWKLTFIIGNINSLINLSPLAGDINWMETWTKLFLFEFCHKFWKGSPLAGDINWMETFRNQTNRTTQERDSPHSLGTLIEWKPHKNNCRPISAPPSSPLAGDINWMETRETSPIQPDREEKSPLAGDINWMETTSFFLVESYLLFLPVPTRWGH